MNQRIKKLNLINHKIHWIFDLDGTLTQSIHDFSKIKQRLNLSQDNLILETLNQLPSHQAKEKHIQLERIEMEYAEQAEVMPGVHNLLSALKADNKQIGILTRNTFEVAIRTLQVCGLSSFFHSEDIIDRNMCLPKPSAAGIFKLLDKWQAKANQAVMVGDSIFDIEAGRNAQVTTIHIDPNERFEHLEVADLSISGFSELC